MKAIPSAIKFHYTASAPSKDADSLEHMKYAKQQVAELSSSSVTDKVTLSEEAKKKLAQDLTIKKPEPEEQSATDNIIETLKEQIELLMKRLNKIKYDNSEQAKQERKQLQNQINALNAVLLDFLGKKLNTI